MLMAIALTSGCGPTNDAPAPGAGAGAGSNQATATSAPKTNTAKTFKIGAVLPMFSHPFFVAQKQGLEERAKELGVEIDVRDGQDDDLKQITQVEALINRGIDLLILCPRDEDALIPAVEAANRANIPVVTLNRRVNGGKFVTYVGADDAQGGATQGTALIAALGPKGGKIIYLQGTQGSSPQRKRNEGLQSILKSHSEIVIADDRFTNFQEDKAKAVMSDLVRRHDKGAIAAIVTQADELAVPASEVARGEGWNDIKVIGFNGSKIAFDAIKSGHLFATILQDPVAQGKAAVTAAVDHLQGKTITEDVITPLELITKANIDQHKPAY
jgi:ribose transport system substrate-binding protein